jgi:hypothetical protein
MIVVYRLTNVTGQVRSSNPGLGNQEDVKKNCSAGSGQFILKGKRQSLFGVLLGYMNKTVELPLLHMV